MCDENARLTSDYLDIFGALVPWTIRYKCTKDITRIRRNTELLLNFEGMCTLGMLSAIEYFLNLQHGAACWLMRYLFKTIAPILKSTKLKYTLKSQLFTDKFNHLKRHIRNWRKLFTDYEFFRNNLIVGLPYYGYSPCMYATNIYSSVVSFCTLNWYTAADKQLIVYENKCSSWTTYPCILRSPYRRIQLSCDQEFQIDFFFENG